MHTQIKSDTINIIPVAEFLGSPDPYFKKTLYILSLYDYIIRCEAATRADPAPPYEKSSN